MKSTRFEIVWEKFFLDITKPSGSRDWTEVKRIKTNSRLKVFSARLANFGHQTCPPLVPGFFVMFRLTIVDHGKS